MWIRTRNTIAYPRGWQRPAKTEEWAYEQCLDGLAETPFAQIVCFPWASLIDLLRRGFRSKARPYLDALASAPPRNTLIRATVCQHIDAKDMIAWLGMLKITDLFWSHSTVDEPEIDGIRVHPFPLYPVRCNYNSAVVSSGGKSASERKHLYSFVGAYCQRLYLTPVRQWIFELPAQSDSVVVRREEWHYDGQVYGEQVAGARLSDQDMLQHQQRSLSYDAVLQESVFCLCPSGSGPNSIRLWESLGFGCIPVLLSDTLRLPGRSEDWAAAMLRVPETREAVVRLPTMLAALADDKSRLESMRQAGRRLWQRYGMQGPITLLNNLTQSEWVWQRMK
jgi:hypothetical protein